ncbi:MAG TPA: sulfite exporter TauE/SafE family protein [Holophagaceae bacterium]|nr:sulfite exporter TauE/SafE family protein [Holophagaceae bacterium]
MTHLFQFLAGAGSGIAGGVLSGMFGIGGGIVLVPLLGLALHLDQHRAQGVTLAAMLLPIGLPAVLHFRRQGVPLRWSLVGLIVLGFFAGVLLGSEVANRIPPRPLRLIFVAFLLLVAIRTLRDSRRGEAAAAPEAPLRQLVLPGLVIGLVGGAASGLLGIGGGIVLIPALIWWLGYSQLQATVTSLAVMLPPIGLPGVLIYARAQGGLPWTLLAGVAVGFAAGAALGARVALRFPVARLRLAFAALVIVTATVLAMKA